MANNRTSGNAIPQLIKKCSIAMAQRWVRPSRVCISNSPYTFTLSPIKSSSMPGGIMANPPTVPAIIDQRNIVGIENMW